MKLLKYDEKHELGNGWGFYIDTDVDIDLNCSIQYKNIQNIVPVLHTINNNYINNNLINKDTNDTNDTNEIHIDKDNDLDYVSTEIISILSVTFTCLLAFFVH